MSPVCGTVAVPADGDGGNTRLLVLVASGRAGQSEDVYQSTLFYLDASSGPGDTWQTGAAMPAKVRKPPASGALFSFREDSVAIHAIPTHNGEDGLLDYVMELDTENMEFVEHSVASPYLRTRVNEHRSVGPSASEVKNGLRGSIYLDYTSFYSDC